MYSRDEIIAGADYLDADKAFMRDIQYFLRDAVAASDVDLVFALLKVGANPNSNPDFQYEERNYGFLHDLAWRYEVERTLRGDDIEKIFEMLLQSGADPNQPGDCNMAPIQRCTSDATSPLRRLLIKYGANPGGNPVY